jgi:hypothetical protein
MQLGMAASYIELVDLNHTQQRQPFQLQDFELKPFDAYPKQLYDELPFAPGARYIRVLDLEGVSGGADEALRGTPRVVDLNDSPGFAALSYVWGPYSTPKHTISCNSYTVGITTNCYHALHSLRGVLGPITIWVDSICINQEDDREKTYQLPLMGDIYTYARPAFIWLGQGSEETDRAITCLKLASHLRVPPIGMLWNNHSRPRRWQERLLLLLGIGRVWLCNVLRE